MMEYGKRQEHCIIIWFYSMLIENTVGTKIRFDWIIKEPISKNFYQLLNTPDPYNSFSPATGVKPYMISCVINLTCVVSP